MGPGTDPDRRRSRYSSGARAGRPRRRSGRPFRVSRRWPSLRPSEPSRRAPPRAAASYEDTRERSKYLRPASGTEIVWGDSEAGGRRARTGSMEGAADDLTAFLTARTFLFIRLSFNGTCLAPFWSDTFKLHVMSMRCDVTNAGPSWYLWYGIIHASRCCLVCLKENWSRCERPGDGSPPISSS
jgi:hypothetical protein